MPEPSLESITAQDHIDINLDVTQWRLNEDGGYAVIKQAAKSLWGLSLELNYDATKPWCNFTSHSAIPHNAIGIAYSVKPIKVSTAAAQFVWMMEDDGDGHLAMAAYEQGGLGSLPVNKWHDVFIALNAFNYEPRGDGKNNLLAVNRVMLGFNGGPAHVEISNLRWICQSAQDTTIPQLAWRQSDGSWNLQPGYESPLPLKDSTGVYGFAAIFADNVVPQPGFSDPRQLVEQLSSLGYQVILSSADQLASYLNSGQISLLVMPYGPYYPDKAKSAIRDYLKRGGSLLCSGGYAFDAPVVRDRSGKLTATNSSATAEQLANTSAPTTPLNTRTGAPGDTMVLAPDQVGMFDPTWAFHASQLEAHDNTSWSGEDFSGFASCCLLGNNDPVYARKYAHYTSLVKAYNTQGYCADALGIVQHYAGAFSGGCWAFSGVQTHDLFAPASPIKGMLSDIIFRMNHRVVIEKATTDKAMYSAGEMAQITVSVTNFSACHAALLVTVTSREGKELLTKSMDVSPSKDNSQFRFKLPVPSQTDLCHIECRLKVDSRIIQTLDTGICVRQTRFARAFIPRWRQNTVHKGNRPILAIGTNQTGMVFNAGDENPWTWDHDLQKMEDYGLSLMRILHFFPQQNPAGERYTLSQGNPEWALSKLDAILQLCQKHGIAMILSLHDWIDQDLSEEELTLERKMAYSIASRYKGIPGFIIDVQNEPAISLPVGKPSDTKPYLTKGWNEYLKAKYTDDTRLQKAWSVSPPESKIGSIPYYTATNRWDDVRSCDADVYRTQLMAKWAAVNTKGIKDADKNRLVLVGFLQELIGCNKLQAVNPVDIANMHSYTDLDTFSGDIRMFDRRLVGKGLSVGEFGSIIDHDARTNGRFTTTMQHEFYLARLCYLFGAGGSFICNWSWKEMEETIFPWGLFRQNNGIPKSMAGIYRNMALLLRGVRPSAALPAVWLVIPIENLYGGEQDTFKRMIYQQAWQLMEAGIPFCTVDDQSLATIKERAEVIIYPNPMHVPANVYKYLTKFISEGGRLLTSGDLAYSDIRQRSATANMQRLCGIKATNIKAKPWQNEWADIQLFTSEGRNVVSEHTHTVGKGVCIYNRQQVYTAAQLLSHKIKATPIRGAHVMPLQEQSGIVSLFGVTHTPRATADIARSLVYNGGKLQISDAAQTAFYARLDSTKRLISGLTNGPVSTAWGNVTPSGQMGIMSLDERPINTATSIIILGMGTPSLAVSVSKPGYSITRGSVQNGQWKAISTKALTKGVVNITDVEQEIFIVSHTSTLNAAISQLIKLLHAE